MRLSFYVSALAWFSTFILAWLLIVNRVPANGLTLGFFAFFLLVGTLAGIQSTSKAR